MSINSLRKKYQLGKLKKSDYISEMHKIHSILFDYSILIPSTDISKIEISDNRVIMTSKTNNIKMICTQEDERIAPIEILNFGNYDELEIELIVRLVPKGAIIFDIGSNFGWYSFSLEKMIKKSEIYSFEPVPLTYSYLVENIKINRSTKIIPYNFGFSNNKGTFPIYYDPKGSGNASLKNLHSADKIVECRLDTLDNFCGQNNKTVDFIKCDVEGAELYVFQGGINTIKENNPIIFTEMLRKWSTQFGYHPNDIIIFFKDLGYKCFYLEGKTLREIRIINEKTVPTNFFFLHEKKHNIQIARFTG
jgi:FkbM family methyltransferase